MALIYCNKTHVLLKSKTPLAPAHEIFAQASHACSYEGHYVRQVTFANLFHSRHVTKIVVN